MKKVENERHLKVADVVEYNGVTINHIPAKKILDKAIEENYDDVIVIGTKDDVTYYNSSESSIAELLLQLERCKLFLLNSISD